MPVMPWPGPRAEQVKAIKALQVPLGHCAVMCCSRGGPGPHRSGVYPLEFLHHFHEVMHTHMHTPLSLLVGGLAGFRLFLSFIWEMLLVFSWSRCKMTACSYNVETVPHLYTTGFVLINWFPVALAKLLHFIKVPFGCLYCTATHWRPIFLFRADISTAPNAMLQDVACSCNKGVMSSLSTRWCWT